MTQIYNYDRETGEYVSEQQAQLDPLDNKPLIPAFSTTLKPPVAGDAQAVIFSEGAWLVVPDNRGKKYYLPDGSEHVIADLNKGKPAGSLDAPPPPTQTELKEKATSDITAWATSMRISVAGAADAYKLAGWADKAQRAARFAAGTETTADKSVIQQESSNRGLSETAAELAAKQATKALRLSTAVSIIDGIESALLTLVDSSTVDDALTTTINNKKAAAETQLAAL